MISYVRGNLLEADVEALVNTVNTVGVMGKGIALQFKNRFAANFLAYAQACKLGQVQTGLMFVTEPQELMGPRWIVNFPTKRHWRDPSRLEWVVDGLQDLRSFLVSNAVPSIALPALGAGFWVACHGPLCAGTLRPRWLVCPWMSGCMSRSASRTMAYTR